MQYVLNRPNSSSASNDIRVNFLLQHAWADYELEENDWVKSDGEWKSGVKYPDIYNHFVNELDTTPVQLYAWKCVDSTFLPEIMIGKIVYTREMPEVGNGARTCGSDGVYSVEGYLSRESENVGVSTGLGYTYTYNRDTSSDKIIYEPSISSSTETIGSTTITFYLAEDGHKICLPDQITNINSIYEATGVAWYYVLDEENQRFKLPITKWGFSGVRDNVGDYIAQDVKLPNITGSVSRNAGQEVVAFGLFNDAQGALYINQTSVPGMTASGTLNGSNTVSIDASRSSSVYSGNGTDTLIQPRSTQQNLYFYSREKLGNVFINYNVGDIFQTLRKDDIDGAVDCDGTLYDVASNVEYQKVIALLEAGKIPSITLADYATALNEDGSVGVFGWDGTGATSFRVPSLNNVFLETASANNIGSYEEAGLPNATGTLSDQIIWENGNATGIMNKVSSGSNFGHASGNYDHIGQYELSLSNSNDIYGNSDTVQPSAVRLRTMVQLTKPVNIVDTNDIDYVIRTQRPTLENDYTWYRLYKSGWVEQGGTCTTPNYQTIMLPIAMENKNYSVQITSRRDSTTNTGDQNDQVLYANCTTSSIYVYINNNTNNGVYWQVSGFSAQN